LYQNDPNMFVGSGFEFSYWDVSGLFVHLVSLYMDATWSILSIVNILYGAENVFDKSEWIIQLLAYPL